MMYALGLFACRCLGWVFIPGAAVQLATCVLFAGSVYPFRIWNFFTVIVVVPVQAVLAPLFKKERHLCGNALITQAAYPLWLHWTRVFAGFAAGDYPVEPWAAAVIMVMMGMLWALCSAYSPMGAMASALTADPECSAN